MAKCGVLRWLVPSSAGGTGSFGHADHVPIKLRHILREDYYSIFYDSWKFLLLASIEFDDLQTAQWLVEECGTRSCGGTMQRLEGICTLPAVAPEIALLLSGFVGTAAPRVV
jgi:hypothetical protein